MTLGEEDRPPGGDARLGGPRPRLTGDSKPFLRVLEKLPGLPGAPGRKGVLE